ncbi:LysR family transcriptional regulator [Rhodococcoides fascians A21d2]|uniref:LysR family transcriptional regulator n=1 Tax=Rhodococcoides fascians TaxID=1828 RepID=UPI00068CB36B|nr:LysR family transcriptional regulator [Rhodococcus fascians]QIH99479.1 LysR family transcriptional regulator [Rhodococcus fascians A21d2]
MTDLDEIAMRHLRYFLTVVREGSVSAAAKELRIAQPSLSNQLRKLEARVGVELFARSAGGMTLTPAGRIFLDGVETIPTQFRAAVANAVRAEHNWSIGVCSGVPSHVIELVERALERQARDAMGTSASIELRSAGSTRQATLLEHGELSFGLARLPLDNDRLVAAQVWREELGVVVGKHHPFAAGPTVTWSQLVTQRLLWFDTAKAPLYASSLLTALHAAGWAPDLVVADTSRHILFQHLLQTNPDLVSLRPRSAIEPDPILQWKSISDGPALEERLGLTAMQGTDYAEIVQRAAVASGWVPGV